MEHQPKKSKKGTLYIVATPIGNSQDWTDRAKVVLSEVDVVAAEDTRVVKKELQKVKIKPKRVVAYHGHNEKDSAAGILEWLLEGKDIAIASDAGTPLVSDPGASIVNLARQNGIPIVPVPGASSLTAAMSVSGLSAPFYFAGFLPAKSEERTAFFKKCSDRGDHVVAFEAPHRIRESLTDAESALGSDTWTVVCRELSKPYEEIIAAPLSQIRAHFNHHEPRGEFVLIFRGQAKALLSVDETSAEIRKLVEQGATSSDILSQLQPLSQMTRKQIYDTVSRLKREKEIV